MQVENQYSGAYIRDETLELKLYQSVYIGDEPELIRF
jgi:hypothetical protein